MKRILSLLLCLSLLLSLFPAAQAEDAGESLPESPVSVEETVPEELPQPPAEEEAPEEPELPELSAEEAPALPQRVRFVCEPADIALALFDPAELDDSGVRFLFRPEEDGSYLLPEGCYAFDAVREGYEALYAVPFTLAGEPLEIPVTLLPCEIKAAAIPESEPITEGDSFAELEESWPNDDLFTRYVDSLFHHPAKPRGARPELNLSAADYYVEQQLKAIVLEIAAGRRSSTEIEVPLGDYVYSDLTPDSIFHTLFKDVTAEMYWFSGRYSWGARDGNRFGCTLRVDGAFQDDNDTHVDCTKILAAQTAVANAAAIVAQYAGCGLIDTLRGYKNAVCELTDYNYSAASAGIDTAGAGPWELVYVFDGDVNTKVVCEGYAKAFQYLCDQTGFGGGFNCICASGAFYPNGSNLYTTHMWNVVTLDDGRNYLIDPTNCDGEPITDKRFLLYATSGRYDDPQGYVVSGTSDRYTYFHRLFNDAGAVYYRSDTLNAFPASLLNLSPLPYGESEAELPLDVTQFPDPGFLAVAALFDGDGSGGLSAAERRDVTVLELNDLGLNSLSGLENFPALETLRCADNSLTVLDLSANPLLKTLECAQNALGELDLSANILLETLDCSQNSLTSLDLNANSYLRSLRCADMPLAALTADRLTALSLLDCGGTLLENLDLSRSPALVRAVLEGTCLSADGNKRWLLGTEDAPEALLVCPSSTQLDTGAPALDAAYFPDSAFLSFVTHYDTDGDGLLSHAERSVVGKLDCSNCGIADLTGLAYFPYVTNLNCSGNSLTTLDLSHLSGLTTLYCQNNSLTALDLSHNRSLQILQCDQNSLGTLDLEANPNLSSLRCSNAGLTELKLRGLTKLKTLYCDQNSLDTLDLQTSPSLSYLKCNNAALRELNLSGLSALQTLYCYSNALTTLDLSTNRALRTLYVYRNSLTSLTLGAAAELSKFYCYSNKLSTLDLSGCRELLRLCASGELTSSANSTYRQLTYGSSVLNHDKSVLVTAGSDTVWTTASHFYAAAAAAALLNAASVPESAEPDRLFCGWYRDAACTVPVTAASDLGAAGSFAKYISLDVLNTAVQVRQTSLSGQEGCSDIRFVSSVPDSLYYNSIGFELTLSSHDGFLVCDQAFSAPLYDEIYADRHLYDLAQLHSLGLFPDIGDSSKIAVQTVTGFPARFFAAGNPYVFHVRPYLVTNDGTRSYGRDKYFTLATDTDCRRDAIITDSLGAPV